MEILHSAAPAAAQHSLLMVYTRRVVGLTYEVCERCASGTVVAVHVDSPLQDSGLGTRAISHLRSCYPDVTWHSSLAQRMTRDLAHRMSLPDATGIRRCPHARSTAQDGERQVTATGAPGDDRSRRPA
ncbi:hypothetical protein SALBM135S_06355 [Streptomyces alboniger]